MTSATRTGRFERLFESYDTTRDGFLTLEDFTHHAHKLGEMRGLGKDSPQLAALLSALESWWKQVEEASDFDKDGRVTRDEFVDYAKGQARFLAKSVEAAEQWPLKGWIDSLFDVVDADGDGRITVDEYRAWLTALGVADTTDVEAAFAGFDKNSDGHLSRDEFTEVSRQFWLSDDPASPGHRWLGP